MAQNYFLPTNESPPSATPWLPSPYSDASITSSKLATNLTITGGMTAASLTGDGSQLTNLNLGSTFIRWGNATAPTGTSLLYSGIAFGSNYTHSGAVGPVVIATGDPGPSAPSASSLLYPLVTDSNGDIPTGITEGCFVRDAVCHAPGPTTVIWGTWSPPTGWSVLYKGYSMGAKYTHAAGLSLICVDSDAFDASLSSTGASGSGLLYPSQLGDTGGLTGYTASTFVKAAVVMKDPAPAP